MHFHQTLPKKATKTLKPKKKPVRIRCLFIVFSTCFVVNKYNDDDLQNSFKEGDTKKEAGENLLSICRFCT